MKTMEADVKGDALVVHGLKSLAHEHMFTCACIWHIIIGDGSSERVQCTELTTPCRGHATVANGHLALRIRRRTMLRRRIERALGAYRRDRHVRTVFMHSLSLAHPKKSI